jgi:WD40 repeat protein
MFDPTSTRFALSSEQVTQLRDAATGALIVTLPGSKSRGAFSDDGAQFSLCAGTELLVVDARTGARVSAQQGCAGVVAFLEAGRLVVQTSCCAFHIWLADGDEKARTPLPGSLGVIDSVTAHNGAQRIVASDYSGMVTMWNSSSQLIGTTRSQGAPTFSPNGAYVAAGGMGDPLHVWSTDAFQLVRDVRVPTRNRPHYPLSVAWTRDSTRFAALHAGDDQLATYRVPRGTRVFRQYNQSTQFAADVMLSDATHELVLQRIATGEVVKRLGIDHAQLSAFDLARDGRRTLLVTEGTRQATVLDLQTMRTISTFKVERPFVQLSADGRIVLEHASSDPMPLRIRDATTGAILHDLSIPDEGELKLSPTGDRIAIPSRDSLRLLDTATGKIVATVPFDRTPLHVVFDPRGRRVFGYGSRARPRVVDARTGLVIAELPLPTSALEVARFDATGDRILTWGNDRVAQLWNANTGELLASVDRVAWGGIALSDDALRIATASDDGAIQIWDAATHRLIGTLPADHDGIGYLAWTAGDTRLISRGRTHTTVWDVHLETRTPADLARLPTGWKLAGSLLVPD